MRLPGGSGEDHQRLDVSTGRSLCKTCPTTDGTMKYTAAFISAIIPAVVAQPPFCEPALLAPLEGISENAFECFSAALSLLPNGGEIDASVVGQICSNQACATFIEDIDASSVPNCTINVPAADDGSFVGLVPAEVHSLYNDECVDSNSDPNPNGQDEASGTANQASGESEADDDSDSSSAAAGKTGATGLVVATCTALAVVGTL